MDERTTMTMLRGLCGLGLAGALLGAGSARADAPYDRCIDEARSNPAYAHCGAQWVEREDVALNVAWKRLLAALDASGDAHDGYARTRRDLLVEQRAWIAYKETACDFYGNEDWGRDGQVLHYFVCRAEVIAARTRQLDEWRAFMTQ
jgi:uncharacterized protein YecT (DUF1311 family)